MIRIIPSIPRLPSFSLLRSNPLRWGMAVPLATPLEQFEVLATHPFGGPPFSAFPSTVANLSSVGEVVAGPSVC